MTRTLYLLHFDRPYPGGQRPQHYLGSTRLPIAERLARHRSGDGAALIRAVEAAGIGIVVAWTLEYQTKGSAYAREMAIKAMRRSLRHYCPHCGGTAMRKGERLPWKMGSRSQSCANSQIANDTNAPSPER